MIPDKKWPSLRTWGMRIAKHRAAWHAPASRLPANSPSSCIACGAIKPSSASAKSQALAPASPRPEEKRSQHHELAREGEPDRSRGDDGPGDLVENPEPADWHARKVVKQIETPVSSLLSRSKRVPQSAMPQDMLLIAVIMLPFAGSVLAALLRANAQSAEAWLAGSIALASLALSSALYPAVSDGGVIYSKVEWMPESRPRLHLAHGWTRLDVRGADHRHRLSRRALRPLLHVAGRSGCRASFHFSWRSWAPCWGSCCPAT